MNFDVRFYVDSAANGLSVAEFRGSGIQPVHYMENGSDEDAIAVMASVAQPGDVALFGWRHQPLLFCEWGWA